MIAALSLACLVGGFFAGWLMRTIFVMAEISRSQERMQRKVHYWQSEAARARTISDQLARRLVAEADPPPGGAWPPSENE
jgi:hypothetical protein